MDNDIPLSFDSEFYSQEYDKALAQKKEEWAKQREYYKRYDGAYWQKYRESQKKKWIIKSNNITFETYRKEFLNTLEENSLRKKRTHSEPSIIVPDAHILEEYNNDLDVHQAAWKLLWTIERPLREAKWKEEEKENQRKWKKEQALKDTYKKAVAKALEEFTHEK